VITRLKIYFTGPSDKVYDDFEFGSDICMMMSDDLQFSKGGVSPRYSYSLTICLSDYKRLMAFSKVFQGLFHV
jgi:hypothetical protein